MAADRFVKMIDASFAYFESLGKSHQDPAGVEAIRQVRDRMVRDLAEFKKGPSRLELAKLCQGWRRLRIEVAGPAAYPPDIFIENVCQVIEVS